MSERIRKRQETAFEDGFKLMSDYNGAIPVVEMFRHLLFGTRLLRIKGLIRISQ